jgi:hypothetical protein
MFYLFLLAHLVANFMLQPYWLVQRKRRWDGLLIHGGLVLGCMLLLPLIDPRALELWPAMLGITAVHVLADWGKVHRYDKRFSRPIVPFLLDQLIHVGTLALALGLSLPLWQVWTLDGSPMAPYALYAGAYVVAAFAVPIGVMIWLDPQFSKVALAGRARLRCLLVGATSVSLALMGGALALPATLIGYAAITRRPASQHPLDMPAGIFAVLLAAVILGAALSLLR